MQRQTSTISVKSESSNDGGGGSSRSAASGQRQRPLPRSVQINSRSTNNRLTVSVPENNKKLFTVDTQRLIAIHRYHKLSREFSRLQEENANLRTLFEEAKQCEQLLKLTQEDNYRKQREIAKTQLLQRAIVIGKAMQDFFREHLEPLFKSYIPLNLSDEKFDKLYQTIQELNVLMSATTNDTSWSSVQEILHTIERLQLDEHFITIVVQKIAIPNSIRDLAKRLDDGYQRLEEQRKSTQKLLSLTYSWKEEINTECKVDEGLKNNKENVNN